MESKLNDFQKEELEHLREVTNSINGTLKTTIQLTNKQLEQLNRGILVVLKKRISELKQMILIKPPLKH
ncbi:MAG: hypothetical protein ACXADY_14865 [Candidatus Hodarchaeales archaeon]|jgi:hypothetical protein